jgi:hypothetical protein
MKPRKINQQQTPKLSPMPSFNHKNTAVYQNNFPNSTPPDKKQKTTNGIFASFTKFFYMPKFFLNSPHVPIIGWPYSTIDCHMAM